MISYNTVPLVIYEESIVIAILANDGVDMSYALRL